MKFDPRGATFANQITSTDLGARLHARRGTQARLPTLLSILAALCLLAPHAWAHLPCQVDIWTANNQFCIGQTTTVWFLSEVCDSLIASQTNFVASTTGTVTFTNQCSTCSSDSAAAYLNIYTPTC
ncbi:MAG TPA: hypothetical protein VMP11_16320 [Verrucomicrobiae bacterium]|nr:hypothetical protein [Verrucomicrobiae bacterium]